MPSRCGGRSETQCGDVQRRWLAAGLGSGPQLTRHGRHGSPAAGGSPCCLGGCGEKLGNSIHNAPVLHVAPQSLEVTSSNPGCASKPVFTSPPSMCRRTQAAGVRCERDVVSRHPLYRPPLSVLKKEEPPTTVYLYSRYTTLRRTLSLGHSSDNGTSRNSQQIAWWSVDDKGC
ncbi:hypothetical protein SKAU_G00031090 [Synaphobranchus kaupii]|uniref:Uncharacterized protein n=1 Tax=Synaphobranchus kaupii TaxID=118154 RepID=A0A9Q1JD61_SYNKA|nr:hypothetical protein SKAU_G00031090 [Synaphobranchus kaupii]